MAIISVLITLAVWKQGLESSFNRPSVASSISLHQQEIALLAKPSIPQSLQSVFLGEDPKASLREALRAMPLEEIEDRDRLLLSTLETDESEKLALLKLAFKKDELASIQEVLLEGLLEQKSFSSNDLPSELVSIQEDPLLYQRVCLELGGETALCSDKGVADKMALRLAASQCLPLIALFLGIVLLLRQLWLLFRRKATSWPQLRIIPLSLVDMILLIGGGFVVLGEVLSPMISIPFSSALTAQLAPPLGESFQVLVGYVVMTSPPLLILRNQLRGLAHLESPSDGWIQWGLSPWNTALVKALLGWLMALPPVLLTGWLMSFFFGDQGGSNPLLELVLSSRDPIALLLLVVTTVALAPLFEELVFRGVLIPVLVRSMGRSGAVLISSFVFAMAHLSVSEFPPLFVLGIGLALLRLSSGRLLPCVLMHALWNGITFTNLLLLGG